ncbi:hypothetical protein KCU95_g18558, partial [Aureobasidium melanogenum]
MDPTIKTSVDKLPPSFWEYHNSDNGFKTWIITRDCSVRLTNDEKKLYPDDSVVSDVEIPSRILDFSNPSPCPHGQLWPCNGQPLVWDWRDEITAIINTLKQKCIKPGFRVFTNETCGLHVHIGRDRFGFTLDTTKNIMGIFTAYERCFDSLLTVDRIAGYENDHHTALPALNLANPNSSIILWRPSAGWKYSLPLSVRQFDHLGHDLMSAYESSDFFEWDTLVRNGASIPYWLRRLYQTTNFAELARLVNASSATIDHYANILSPDYSSRRFHQNTSTQPDDSLTPLYTYNETHRRSQTSPSAISARIMQKLISGRYGQFPSSFLEKFLPREVRNAAEKDAKFLSSEMNEQSSKDWSSQNESVIKKAVQRKNGRGY